MSVIELEYLHDFLVDHGPALGLDPTTPASSTGIAACWDQHPTAVHDLTGIALASGTVEIGSRTTINVAGL